MNKRRQSALKEPRAPRSGQALSAHSPSPDRFTVLAAALLLVTVLAYLPAIRGGYIWDDDAYVTGNLTLRTLSGLGQIWTEFGATPQYYPLVHTSFWIEYHLWGLNPLGFHLVNVTLHAASALLLVLLLRRLSVPGFWLAGFLFAVHPVHVESVAWITERKNVLSGVFYLLSMLCYTGWLGSTYPEFPDGTRPALRPRTFYALALLFYVGALLSKTVTCSLPVAVLLVLWWKRGRIARRDVMPLVPFFVLGAGFGAVTAVMERTRVGAFGADWSLSFVERLLLAPRIIWFYAGKLLLPFQLTFFYPRWTVSAQDAAAWLFPAALIAVLLFLWVLRTRIGRGPLTAALFFCATLFPALGFFNVYPMRYSYVADHFQYHASLGLLVLGAAVAAHGLRSRPAALAGISLSVILALSVLTWRQAHVYRDIETLWRDTLAKNSGAWMAHINLGLELERQGRTEEAHAQFLRAAAIHPGSEEAQTNAGKALRASGRTEEAIAAFRRAIEINPRFPDAKYNLANALQSQERHRDAITLYREVLALKADYPGATTNLGMTLALSGRLDEALTVFHDGVQRFPADPALYNNYGMALLKAGRRREAAECFQTAIRLNPRFETARANLSRALKPPTPP